jgi:formamidase
MQDMVAGRARLPWEDQVVHTDGRACGFAPPTRTFAGTEPNLLTRSTPGVAPAAPTDLKDAA